MMSKLREQLQQAKSEYNSLRYPGDLAADVLDQLAPPRQSSAWKRTLAIAALLALVATVAIVIVKRSGEHDMAQKPTTPIDPTVRVATNPEKTPAVPDVLSPGTSDKDAVATNAETIEEKITLVPGQSVVTEETAVSFVPSFQSISFSLPSVAIGSLDSYSEQEESTTDTVNDQANRQGA